MPTHVMPMSSASSAGGEANWPVAKLTRRMVRMNEAAWTQFYQSYFARLFSYAVTLHRGDRASAEDSVQEALLRAVRNIRRFDDEEVFWSWLTLLVRCAAADQGRKFSVQSRLQKALTESDWNSGKLETTESKMVIFLEAALVSLSEEDRELLEAKYVFGHSAAELASARSCTPKAIECRLRRLRKKLKKQIYGLSRQS